MSKLVEKVKETLTPHLRHRVSVHGSMITAMWISFVILSLAYAMGLLALYMRILRLEDILRTLGSA
ncbi:hypothetical protein KJZ71_00975 [Patescibacteria group bacterium]|jgi:hypothetical protein|uniref:Uncharacterized protein n=1 Tax=candidate division WWE3 bacterium TaxID=2053526 RepID=A0A928Y6R2_UNCKA|nr:hypothetical protein [candidate division WWE3 bacterium]MCL4732359.1 hypothetical protein [Patescibacteria group bacterium]MDL1952784.1 hypothetical protein [Candidatus Uhrbacteria bacterium UHB]RIL01020.1 MAG: hypothetical protein DCC77_00565 [Candidatus Uhrbacteria bacterium]